MNSSVALKPALQKLLRFVASNFGFGSGLPHETVHDIQLIMGGLIVGSSLRIVFHAPPAGYTSSDVFYACCGFGMGLEMGLFGASLILYGFKELAQVFSFKRGRGAVEPKVSPYQQ
jgi:hypothetical protein